MKIEELIAISGLPGLYKMISTRPNGIIVEDLDEGKKKFVPSRKHQFSPLETISIFTITDSVGLCDVLRTMHEKSSTLAPVSPKATNVVLRDYFGEILPEHDEGRVFPRDISKIIKWYNYISDRNLFDPPDEEEE